MAVHALGWCGDRARLLALPAALRVRLWGALRRGSHVVAVEATGSSRAAQVRSTLSTRGVALAFLFATVLAVVLVNVGAAVGTPPAVEPQVTPIADPFSWLQPFVRYDSGWYYSVATNGYFYTPGKQSSVAFFPAYPLMMRAGGPVFGVYLAGVLLTVVAGLVSFLLFARWCATRMSRAASLCAVGLLLVYPYSFYLYGAVYADALFLACALGAFVLLERGHPWLAGLVGVAATAGRPVGVALAVGLTVRAVELARQRAIADGRLVPGPAKEGGWRDRAGELARTAVGSLRFVRWSDTGVLVSGAGLAGYMAYLWVQFEDPLAFASTQSSPGWDQGSGPRVWLKIVFFGTMVYGDPLTKARLLLPALLVIGAILLLPRIQRRLGWGYAAYTAVLLAIPLLGTKDFMGSGRYLLVAFPAFAVLGELLAEHWPRRVRWVVLPASALLLMATTTAYGSGRYVS